MSKKVWLGAIMVSLCLSLANVVYGASVSDTNGDAKTTKQDKPMALEWVMGIVKSINLDKKSIEISYYDFENDKNALVTVYVNKDTEYIGAKSLKDINPGDDIEVSYTYSNDGSRIAEAVITAKFEGNTEDSEEDSEQ